MANAPELEMCKTCFYGEHSVQTCGNRKQSTPMGRLVTRGFDILLSILPAMFPGDFDQHSQSTAEALRSGRAADSDGKRTVCKTVMIRFDP